MILGLPHSTIQLVTVPSGLVTSIWIQEWGLIHSISVTLPTRWTGLPLSNSASNAWCANTGTVKSAPVHAAKIANLSRIDSSFPFPEFYIYGALFARLFFVLAVQQFLGEFHALEFQKLGVVFHPAIKRHADFPGAGENLGILDGGFVIQMIRIGAGESFHHMQLIACEIAGAIEPRQPVQSRHVHYQRVTFPVSVAGSHPRIGAGLFGLAHIDQPIGASVFIHEHDAARRLYNLERVGHVVGARNAGHVALRFGVVGAAILE